MTGVAVPWGRIKFFDPATGEPIANGRVYHYIPNTFVAKATWSDQAQTTPNTNPVVLDAAGEAGIWGDGLYRQILKRADTSTVWDLQTGFLASGGGGGGGDVSGPGASVVGNFAVWGDVLGTLIGDGGTPGALAFLATAPIANGGTGATTAPNARIALGLAIGSDVQAYSANLTAVAGVTSAADKLFYFTGSGTGAVTTFTSFARMILDDADGPAVLITIGAEPAGMALGINTYTANRQIDLTDAGCIVEMNLAGANSVTIPANATTAFPLKTRIDIVQIGAGATSIVAAGGVTIRSFGALVKLAGQYAGASLYKRGTNEWVLIGNLIP